MKPARIAILTLLGGAALLSASGVHAGITSHGNSCVPAHPVLDANSFLYGSTGIGRVTFERAWVVCPLPAEKSIGSVANFDIQIESSYPEERFQCIGAVFDSDGELIASTPIVSSTGKTGRRRLSTEVEVGSTGSTSYSVACFLNGDIAALRVY